MEELVKLFIAIHGSSGWIGIFAGLVVLAIFVFVFSLIYSFVSPVIIRKYKGSNYISWESISKRVDGMDKSMEEVKHDVQNARARMIQLNGDCTALKDMTNRENTHIFNQLSSIWSKMDEFGRDVKDILREMQRRNGK